MLEAFDQIQPKLNAFVTHNSCTSENDKLKLIST
jgi:hypothetical protein